MTARHSTLFTLGSGHSGLGFYTTQRDAALSDAHQGLLAEIATPEALEGDLLCAQRQVDANRRAHRCCVDAVSEAGRLVNAPGLAESHGPSGLTCSGINPCERFH
jgi:hypothetical protein